MVNFFGPRPFDGKGDMKLPQSVYQYVSMPLGHSVSYQFFPKMAHSIFLKFYMKLEGLKVQKLTEPNFSENI